ncbi:MlaA family lipoprotein [Zavarzinia aquatilis]|uniref:MlaA family lipoprotein n=1 Tax=Zavarzinia aquatilis TaxID=2211142 RepID=UPI001402DE08|nr:VacJ family lipoprotein [Zavarzinia aquatilis]
MEQTGDSGKALAIVRGGRSRFGRLVAAGMTLLLIAGAMGGCATKPPASDVEARAEYDKRNDPIEPLNRYFFEVNRFLDYMLLKHFAEIYKSVVPDPVQTGLRNFLNNLESPVILANDLLQGDFGRAKVTTARFIANTIVGVGGVYDFASHIGYPRHTEDFGQTLASWGVGEGPYLVLPLLGPRPPRDLVGVGVDLALNPINWALMAADAEEIGYGLKAADIIDSRAHNGGAIEEVEASSIDFYAAIRNLYRQQRQAAIENRDSGTADMSQAAPR